MSENLSIQSDEELAGVYVPVQSEEEQKEKLDALRLQQEKETKLLEETKTA